MFILTVTMSVVFGTLIDLFSSDEIMLSGLIEHLIFGIILGITIRDVVTNDYIVYANLRNADSIAERLKALNYQLYTDTPEVKGFRKKRRLKWDKITVKFTDHYIEINTPAHQIDDFAEFV